VSLACRWARVLAVAAPHSISQPEQKRRTLTQSEKHRARHILARKNGTQAACSARFETLRSANGKSASRCVSAGKRQRGNHEQARTRESSAPLNPWAHYDNCLRALHAQARMFKGFSCSDEYGYPPAPCDRRNLPSHTAVNSTHLPSRRLRRSVHAGRYKS